MSPHSPRPSRPPARRLALLSSLLATLLSVLALAGVAHADPARRVYAGVYLHDVTKFDQKDGVFDVDLELWAKWLGDFDPDQLRIANAAEVDRTLLGQEADGAWHSARWRVRGTLRGEFPLHRFPFDAQTLAVVLELPESDGTLVPDLAGSGMRERFSITGWLYDPEFHPRVARETYRSDLGSVSNEGNPTSVRRAAFEVTMHRPLLTAAVKLFLPLLMILLVALIALFLPAEKVDARASIGVTALLACFAFQFAVSDSMPDVSYLTLADVLFLLSYAFTALLLAVSIAVFFTDARGRPALARRIDRAARVALPLVVAIPCAVLVRPPATAQTIVHAPPLRGERPRSDRAVLRVGATQLTSAIGSPFSDGAYWPSVRREPDGTRVPALVEQLPGVESDALRFLADGRLEVSWRLRPGLRWSDGTPLTSDDLRFALEVSPNPQVVDVRTPSPDELVVRYNDRVAEARDGFTPLPRHALAAEFRRGGYDAVRDFRRTHAVPGAGPYRVVQFVANERMVLEANPYFVGPAPSIRRVEIRRYADGDALVRAFEAGEIDLIVPNAISPDQASALAQRRPDAVHVRASDVQLFLNPDLSQPLLARRDVRRAILMAIDRDRMRRDVYGEEARVSHVPLAGPVPAGAAQVPYDPDGARALLAAAGAQGAHLPLFRGRSPVDRALAAHVIADLAAVGLVLDEQEVASPTDTYRQHTHGGLLLHSITGEREGPPRKYWNVPTANGQYVDATRNDAYDDEVATLVAHEQRALYTERREQLRERLLVAYTQHLPNLPLLFLADRVVVDPALRGWEAGTGINFADTLERWYFTAAGEPSGERAAAHAH